jgi:hypothetical protein
MPITEITKTVEQQVLDALNVAQEAVVDGLKTLAEAVDPLLPDVPRPFAEEASQLVDGAFTFAEKLLHNSHEFVGRLLEATDTSSAPAPAPKPAPAAATKAGAK